MHPRKVFELSPKQGGRGQVTDDKVISLHKRCNNSHFAEHPNIHLLWQVHQHTSTTCPHIRRLHRRVPSLHFFFQTWKRSSIQHRTTNSTL